MVLALRNGVSFGTVIVDSILCFHVVISLFRVCALVGACNNCQGFLFWFVFAFADDPFQRGKHGLSGRL